MADADASPPPVQHSVQHRPALGACIVGQERGLRCLPVVPGSPYCHNHHPDRREQQSAQNSIASKTSHAIRTDPELEAWADNLDFSPEKLKQTLQEVAQFVAKGALTAAQGNAIAALARVATVERSAKPAPTPVEVVVQRFGPPNGSEPTS